MRISSFSGQKFAVAEINNKQAEIARLQAQISSGKQLQRPSDAPAKVAETENLDAALLRLDQFNSNGIQVEQKLVQEETVLDNLTDTLQRLKELAVAANSGAINDNNLQAYRAETGQIKNQVLDYANTKTANGEYLFGGGKSRNKPFSSVGGALQYNGDQTQNYIQISDSRKVMGADSGDKIFQRILDGNGKFSATADQSNTGSGVIGSDSVIDSASFMNANYSIEFTSNNNFNVVNTDSGTTVLAAQNFTEGDAIQFDGMEIAIQGNPAAGDQFTLAPSRHQDMLSIVDQFYSALSSKPENSADNARYHQAIDQVLENLNHALDHVGSVRSDLGSRLGYIDNTRSENESVNLVLTQTRSRIEDTDFAAAISNLQTQMTTLEAVRQTYSKIGSLSLFDYLR